VGDAQGELEREIEERVDEEPRKPDQQEQQELRDRSVPEPVQAEQVPMYRSCSLRFILLSPCLRLLKKIGISTPARTRLDEDLERDLVAQRRQLPAGRKCPLRNAEEADIGSLSGVRKQASSVATREFSFR
jgi:hypothetical protein